MNKVAIAIVSIMISCNLTGCVTAVIAGGAAAAAGITQVATDRRTLGSQIDDEAIENVAIDEIKSIDKIGYENSHLGATSINGYLLIHGQTKSKLIKENIEPICKKIKGVTKVYNAVTIQENIDMAQRSKDTWITTKVKSKLLTTSNVSSNNLKIVTENSIVYMMGLVSPTEGNIAAKVAADTEGVTKVVKIFTYIGKEDKKIDENKNSSKDDTVKIEQPSQEILTSDTITITDN